MSSDEVRVLTVDELLEIATEKFIGQYSADNGERPSDEQIAEFRGQIVAQAQEMHEKAMEKFRADRLAKTLSPLAEVDHEAKEG